MGEPHVEQGTPRSEQYAWYERRIEELENELEKAHRTIEKLINNRKGGRGKCDKCGEWHNNVAYHRAHECKGVNPNSLSNKKRLNIIKGNPMMDGIETDD